LQSADGPIQQRPDDRLGGRIPRQRVQIPLHGGGGVFFAHGESTPDRGAIRRDFTRPGVPLPLFSRQTGMRTPGNDAAERRCGPSNSPLPVKRSVNRLWTNVDFGRGGSARRPQKGEDSMNWSNAAPAGPSVGAGSEAESSRPALADLLAADRR